MLPILKAAIRVAERFRALLFREYKGRLVVETTHLIDKLVVTGAAS
jgi:hypothetical protein